MKTYKIGRLSSNDICFPNDHVSRMHADLTCKDDGTFVLTDHSTNGTKVNGHPLNNASMPVKYGDEIVFGNESHLDWSQIKKPEVKKKNRTLAIAGLIVLGVVLLVILVMVAIIGIFG